MASPKKNPVNNRSIKFGEYSPIEFDKMMLSQANFLDAIGGKRQLLEFNWQHRLTIKDAILNQKPLDSADPNYSKLEQNILNSICTPILLDMHSLYMQSIELLMGLILSLHHNKGSGLLFYNLFACENEDSTIQPSSIYNEIEHIAKFNKTPIRTLNNYLDLNYSVFADLKYGLTNKDKNFITRLIYQSCLDGSDRRIYNLYKHRSRVVTGRFPIKINDKNVANSEFLNFFEYSGSGKIGSYIALANFEDTNLKVHRLIELILIIIQNHSIRISKAKPENGIEFMNDKILHFIKKLKTV
jgi:hypothetical protein